MTCTRTVELSLTPADLAEIALDTTWDKLWAAIGYLSSWASDSPKYTLCAIHRDGSSSELLAVYMDAERVVRYAIGAIWHDTHYGFHS